MIINKIKNSVTISLAVILIGSCGQILPGGRKNIKDQLTKARKNLITAESIQDIKRRNELLNRAKGNISQAESLSNREKIMINEIPSAYAYYYYVLGEYSEAKKFCDKALRNISNAFLKVLNARIMLKQKGNVYTKKAEGTLKDVIKRLPNMSMAHLALGDTYFLMGNFTDARKHYEKIMTKGGDHVAQAADRLEDLNEIRSTGIKTQKVQNILFTTSVKRDEVANILHKVFHVEKKIKTWKKLEGNFKDISKSRYADSIHTLRGKGFFSYIQGDKFNPFKIVNRGEMAKIIEDFIVLKTKNEANRKRFINDKESPITGIEVNDPFYNSVRIAVKYDIMNISLNGSIDLVEPVSGIESLITIRKMIQRFTIKNR